MPIVHLPFAFFQRIGLSELLVILAVFLLLFGGARLPQLARSLGQSVVEFKKGFRGGDDDERPDGNLPSSDKK